MAVTVIPTNAQLHPTNPPDLLSSCVLLLEEGLEQEALLLFMQHEEVEEDDPQYSESTTAASIFSLLPYLATGNEFLRPSCKFTSSEQIFFNT